MRISRASRLLLALAVLVIAGGWGVVGQQGRVAPWLPDRTTTAHGPARIAERRHVPGYDRDCREGHLCVFGPAWSDDVDVALGHNGCNTRADIMRAQMQQVELKPGTNGCVVQRGVLIDPYTATTVRFDRSARPGMVEVDHVYPLAAAWDHGAAQWSPRARRDFANDPRNLIATLKTENRIKGDRTPAEWLPRQGRCRYVSAYLAVAESYGLSISSGDDRALARVAQSCP